MERRWEVRHLGDPGVYFVHRSEAPDFPLYVPGTVEEARAIAELVAAAPEMQKALRLAQSRMADCGCTMRDDDYRAVVDAIAKADQDGNP